MSQSPNGLLLKTVGGDFVWSNPVNNGYWEPYYPPDGTYWNKDAEGVSIASETPEYLYLTGELDTEGQPKDFVLTVDAALLDSDAAIGVAFFDYQDKNVAVDGFQDLTMLFQSGVPGATPPFDKDINGYIISGGDIGPGGVNFPAKLYPEPTFPKVGYLKVYFFIYHHAVESGNPVQNTFVKGFEVSYAVPGLAF